VLTLAAGGVFLALIPDELNAIFAALDHAGLAELRDILLRAGDQGTRGTGS
jgi:hypothetical protein